MDSEADDPLAMLEALKGLPVVNALDGNALILHFLKAGGTQVEGRMLRIQHPWRLLFGKVVVGESVEFDGRGKGGREERERRSLGFAGWVPGAITAFSVGLSRPDLWLAFQSGHALETLPLPENRSSWSLKDIGGRDLVASVDFQGFRWDQWAGQAGCPARVSRAYAPTSR